MAELSFDASEVAPAQAFTLLPRGEYLVIVAASDVKMTKKGDGELLEVEYHVIDGDLEGRRIWDRFNLVNPNEQAQNIGRSQLSALCGALGIAKLNDSEELHDKPLVIDVTISKRKDTGEDQNRIVGWRSAEGAASPAPAAPAAAKPAPVKPAAPAPAKAAPWAKARAA